MERVWNFGTASPPNGNTQFLAFWNQSLDFTNLHFLWILLHTLHFRSAKWRSSKLEKSAWLPCLRSRAAYWEGICQNSWKGIFFILHLECWILDLFLSQIGKEKTIWFNCRQEPVAYVNGVSVTPRWPPAYYMRCIWYWITFKWWLLNRSKKNPHANIESSDCLEVGHIPIIMIDSEDIHQ